MFKNHISWVNSILVNVTHFDFSNEQLMGEGKETYNKETKTNYDLT